MMIRVFLDMSAVEVTIKTCLGINRKVSKRMNPAGTVIEVSRDHIKRIEHPNMIGDQVIRERRISDGDRINKRRRSKL